MDIEKMFKLAEESPEEFEAYSKEILQGYLDTLPEERRRKAEQTQWKLDGVLRKYKNPIARMNKASELLYSKLNELNEILNGR